MVEQSRSEETPLTDLETQLPGRMCLEEWGKQYVGDLITKNPELLEGLTTADLLDGDWAEIIRRVTEIRERRIGNWQNLLTLTSLLLPKKWLAG